MHRSERLKTITEAIRIRKRTVAELAIQTGASTITIRRDLAELAELGIIRRVRGGAEAAVITDFPFDNRTDWQETKDAIADAAVPLVSPNDTVFFDNGITITNLARRLAGFPMTAMVLGLYTAVALTAKPGCEVILPGGAVEPEHLTLVNAETLDAVSAMSYDIALFGTCAADLSTGLSHDNWNAARVCKAVLTRSKKNVLLFSAVKFSCSAPYIFGRFEDFDTLITTADAPTDTIKELRWRGLEVILV
jgi:DeoR/GlpR family transcriptional regulator of sugar metabolism